MLLTTSKFRISPATYIRRIIKRWFNRYLLVLAALTTAFIILGTAVNPAFFIVALIFLFIIAPTALMFVYYYYGLMPRTVMLSAGDTAVTLYPDNIAIEVLRENAPPYSFSIPVKSVREIIPGDVHDVIVYGKNPGDIVLIDKNAFPDQPSRIKFHNYIFDNIQKI